MTLSPDQKQPKPSPHESTLEYRVARTELKLRGIEEISRELGSEHNLERILDAVMHRTTSLMDADRATLYLTDAAEYRLWSKVLQGEELTEISLPIGQGIAGWVAEHGKKVNVKDAYRDPRFDQAIDKRSNFRTRSILCLPLRDSQGQIIGVIQVLNKRDGYFTPADEDLLAAIASQAAISIQNSKLYLDLMAKNLDLQEAQSSLEHRRAELETLFGVERACATAQTKEAALSATMEVTLAEFPCEVAAVLLLDRINEGLRYELVCGPQAHRIAPASHPLSAPGLITTTITSGAACTWRNDIETHQLSLLQESQPDWVLHNAICLPLAHKDAVHGCLLLINHGVAQTKAAHTTRGRRLNERNRDFDTDTIRLLTMIARRVALSLVLAQAIEEEKKAERLATIGQMLAGIVHDLKTPLTIINGYAQLMAKDETAETRHEYKALVQKQVGEIKSMTHELLGFARGECQILLRKVLVSHFVNEVNELLREDFADSNVDLVVDTRYRGTVRMDPNKMKRLVYNLARNAREAMPEGGVFRIEVEQDASQVSLRFIDNGPGIPKEMTGRLFDPFATFGKRDGTGLGLAIVKKIVDEHEGTLTVESHPAKGSCFTVKLPLS